MHFVLNSISIILLATGLFLVLSRDGIGRKQERQHLGTDNGDHSGRTIHITHKRVRN